MYRLIIGAVSLRKRTILHFFILKCLNVYHDYVCHWNAVTFCFIQVLQSRNVTSFIDTIKHCCVEIQEARWCYSEISQLSGIILVESSKKMTQFLLLVIKNIIFFKWQKYINFKLKLAKMWILICLTYVPTFSMKLNSQIENQECDYMLLGTSGFFLLIVMFYFLECWFEETVSSVTKWVTRCCRETRGGCL